MILVYFVLKVSPTSQFSKLSGPAWCSRCDKIMIWIPKASCKTIEIEQKQQGNKIEKHNHQ